MISPIGDALCEALYRNGTRLLHPLLARARPGTTLPAAARREGPRLWLHAGTRAGLQTASGLLPGLRIRFPELQVLLTVVSEPARAEAERDWGGEGVRVGYLPPDTPRAARRFLHRARPDAAVCLGPGLWPNLARALAHSGTPWVWLVTAVLPAPWRRVRRLPCLYRPTLRRPARILLAREADRTPLEDLGVPADRIAFAGNPLLDAAEPPPRREARRLRGYLKGRPLLFFTGTEPGEEELFAGVCSQLPAPFTRWLMLLEPADPRRGPELAERLARFGLKPALASRGDALGPDIRVYVLDDPEQAPVLLAAADAVVLGGTWIRGFAGADPLPAAAAGRPVVYGPYLGRHREGVLALNEAGATREAPNLNQLLATLRRWLQQAGEAEATGRRGRELVAAHRGARERVGDHLARYLAP